MAARALLKLTHFIALLILCKAESEDEHRISLLETQIKHLLDKSVDQDSTIENLKQLITSQNEHIQDQNEHILDQNVRITSLEDKVTSAAQSSKLYQMNNNTVEERLKHLEEVAKTKILRSCEELHDHGVSESGWYHIDPDGEGTGLPPIRARCDFEYGVTEIVHDSDDEFIVIPHCEDPHCFTKDLVYTAPAQQMQALIQLSSSCSQDIVYNCYQAPLQYNDINLGTWADKEGASQVYFDGSYFGQHRCSCFEQGACSGENLYNTTCNCDNRDVPEWMEDSGKITNSTALPISSFTYGPLLYVMQAASVKIGPLRCSGKARISNPPTTCNHLKILGEMHPGFYSLNGEEGYPRLAFCDMDIPGYTGDMETQSYLHKFSTGPGLVVFSVRHNGQNDIQQGATVTYDQEMVNIGNGMDLETGIFTAPVHGVYELTFSGLTEADTGVVGIWVSINDGTHVSIHNSNEYGYNTLARSCIVQLEKGDEVKLIKHAPGGLHSNPPLNNHAFEFIGNLL